MEDVKQIDPSIEIKWKTFCYDKAGNLFSVATIPRLPYHKPSIRKTCATSEASSQPQREQTHE